MEATEEWTWGDGQEGWVMGLGGKDRGREGGREWVIFCPQEWSAGVDLHLIKSDNQLSVKDIVLSCPTKPNTGSDSSWTGYTKWFYQLSTRESS